MRPREIIAFKPEGSNVFGNKEKRVDVKFSDSNFCSKSRLGYVNWLPLAFTFTITSFSTLKQFVNQDFIDKSVVCLV